MLNCSWQLDQFSAMGTDAHILIMGGDIGLLSWARAEIERLEGLWSRFRSTSDVCLLNAHAGRGNMVVAPETAALLERAVELWRATDGLFDPTILPGLEAAGYRSSFATMRRSGVEVRPARPAPGCGGIAIDRTWDAVALPAGVAVDLGGVGKGYAADLVAEGLVARGADGASVGLGGDVRTCGVGPDDGFWDIAVEDPRDETRILFEQRLGNEAIVTSTTQFRRWTSAAGDLCHHLIDPRTGAPSTSRVTSVIACAPHAWWAEGVAKAVLIAGADAGRRLADRLGVEVWLVVDEEAADNSATRGDTALL